MKNSDPICTQCNKECEPVILEWDEPVEFWGMRSVQKFYTVDSHCCRAEVDLTDNFQSMTTLVLEVLWTKMSF